MTPPLPVAPSTAAPFATVLGGFVRAQFEQLGIVTADEAALVDWHAIGAEMSHRLAPAMVNRTTGRSSTGVLRRRIEQASS